MAADGSWRIRGAGGESISVVDLAAGTAKGIASVIADFTGGNDYGEPGHSELVYGETIAESGFGNPAAFAHTVIDWYALATGDLLHGTAEISRESHSLAYSSAAVARSASEYAQVTSWLADVNISAADRIARTANLVLKSMREDQVFLDQEERAAHETTQAAFRDWAERPRVD